MKECVAAYCPYNRKHFTSTSVHCDIADSCYFHCPPVWYITSDSTTPVFVSRPGDYVYGAYDKYLDVCKNCRWYHGHCVELKSPYAGEIMGWNEHCSEFRRKE